MIHGGARPARAVEQLRDQAAKEFNWLLSAPPHWAADGFDYGWYCREHAYCTVVVGALLGLQCEVVRGDILVFHAPTQSRLSTLGAGAEHVYCRTMELPVLDLSLKLQPLLPGVDLDKPIVRLGRHGSWRVRILPGKIQITADLGPGSVIGYIPRSIIHGSAREFVESPTKLVATEEAGEIASWVALHTAGVLAGQRRSLVGVVHQKAALDQLASAFPDARNELLKALAKRQA